MNVIFTCGGTGGHINPAIAVANSWKERYPQSEILFIGAKGRMEETLVPKAGYPIETIPASGMSREKSWEGLKHNFRAVSYVLQAVGRCKRIIKKFKPAIVVGTGGYASFPALLAANQLGIPICVHEANAMPGLTTRMIARRADKVLTCFAESARYYKKPEEVQVVGMPVNKAFLTTDRDQARRELKLDDRPLVVTAFGSQGAKVMNQTVAELFRLEQEAGFPFQHIHATGSFGWEWMPELVKEKGVELSATPSIRMQEYIYNMPTVMAAADVVISRAGAASCNEIAAAGRPCVLIPSPNVTDNHQEKNARVLEAGGGAVVILEPDCSAQVLMEQIMGILQNPQRSQSMHEALLSMAVPDSAGRVCDIMESLL